MTVQRSNQRLMTWMRWLSCIGLSLVSPFCLIDMYVGFTGDTLMSPSGGNAIWASIGLGSLPLLILPIHLGFKAALAVVYLLGMTALSFLLMLLLAPS